MSISSIKIENLLSFEDFIINDIADINCIVGKNNTGKSNFFKLISYFYLLLDGGRELPPKLHSSYSKFGRISITYNLTKIRNIVTSSKNRNISFFKHIFNTLFKNINHTEGAVSYELTLTINENNSVEWSTKNKDVLYIICYLYPFFEIQTRHIDLYDWSQLWHLVCRLKSFNVNKLKPEDIIRFFDENLSSGANEYRDYVKKIQGITQTTKYNYRDKVLNFVKVGLDGHDFLIDGGSLKSQSDGTNSYRYIEIFITLLISLTRRDFITPIVCVDEPEVGLHPKLTERLIKKISDTYESFRKTNISFEKGKYGTPYPKIFFSTHSPNVIKSVIKLLPHAHKVYHFSKFGKSTEVRKMVSQYKDIRFLNIFSDNEARLFFSDFILFVEGETELEVFGNLKLINKFKQLEKVDVYKMNAVSLGGINPDFSNAAIPYLVLFDLDKIVNIDHKNENIKFSSKDIDFDCLLDSRKRSYFGSKQFDQKNQLTRYFQNKDGGKIKFDANKICISELKKFNSISMGDFVDIINSEVLHDFNYVITKSTIEGALISPKSRKYFLRWISHEINNCLFIAKDNSINAKINAFININLSSKYDVLKAINALLKPEINYVDLPPNQQIFIANLKAAYIKIILKAVKNTFASSMEFMTAFRLIFNGKTESLITLKHKSTLDAQYCAALTELTKIFTPLNHLTSKTSGWVTRFLDYSLDAIDKKRDTESFNEIFSRYFPELFDILERLQPR